MSVQIPKSFERAVEKVLNPDFVKYVGSADPDPSMLADAINALADALRGVGLDREMQDRLSAVKLVCHGIEGPTGLTCQTTAAIDVISAVELRHMDERGRYWATDGELDALTRTAGRIRGLHGREPGGNGHNLSDTEEPRIKKLPPRVQKAHDQYEQACEALGNDNPTDREAYDVIEKACTDADKTFPLPKYSTWTSYLRRWRRASGQQKSKPRATRDAPVGVPLSHVPEGRLPTHLQCAHSSDSQY